MEIEQIINQIHTIPETSGLKLRRVTEEISLPKGHILFEADKIGRSVYFLKKGIVRAYLFQHDTEVTFWFGREGDTIISMKNYVENKPGYENIELLEDCVLYRIKNRDLQKLFTEDIHIANWGRRFAETELIKTEERLISRQFSMAADRYKALLTNSPDLIQRVQLFHIASYLGITQVSLSRIRAEIR
ncbi:Crp/Fnr family transcriptional regulator [Mucilaginibacter pocheonensis]|uniref:CRP-like cAMP-binding protein n=1 Tax=Mucilaginibacter pocheonensis TaxID=398050 RepID=A0ABU1TCK5_9SPHI|nr:Crp/Fnr family transcriptional regulator [Mucilaginibacter pocheonensis]MDR6943123.1 CRP-like cAMP-binding protein [Mucilaginibacter pocheonensis]